MSDHDEIRTWLIAKDEKIERLEAELADLRASSVVVRRKCETCGGNGRKDSGCPTPEGSCGYTVRCPDCDNGWQLAEGVRLVKFPYEAETTPTFYVIPARLIEGDTDGS